MPGSRDAVRSLKTETVICRECNPSSRKGERQGREGEGKNGERGREGERDKVLHANDKASGGYTKGGFIQNNQDAIECTASEVVPALGVGGKTAFHVPAN